MWCYPQIPNFYRSKSNQTICSTKIHKRALLISGEVKNLKGCTNDILEYALILSRVYGFKEIRILQTSTSERIYGNFAYSILNQIEGVVIHINTLTRNSFLEAFQWLASGNELPYIYDSYIYSNTNIQGKFSNNLYYASELAFVYSGYTTFVTLSAAKNLDENFHTENIESDNFMNFGEDNKKPCFYIEDGEVVLFDELECILSLNIQQPASITCFLDCNFGHYFLSKYTANNKTTSNCNKNKILTHHRISTSPVLNFISNKNPSYNSLQVNPHFHVMGRNIHEKHHNPVEVSNNQINTNQKGHENIKYIQPQIIQENIQDRMTYKINQILTVVIFAACRSSQTAQEMTLCSPNGFNLSIIHRGLFSYCFHSFIRSFMIYRNSNYLTYPPRVQATNITLYMIYERLCSMINSVVNTKKSELILQTPILLTSPNITPHNTKIFQTCLLRNTNYFGFMKRNVNNMTKFSPSNLIYCIPAPQNLSNSENYSNSASYNSTPSTTHSWNSIDTSRNRFYNNIGQNISQDMLKQEIKQLRAELQFLKSTIQANTNTKTEICNESNIQENSPNFLDTEVRNQVFSHFRTFSARP
ncbi:hypothetical protein cand_019040 [Cryptosporidium andersoni]|uniref:Uncharacterized protein n=1 Tax=Cryptosporidium andersoni TaxID=117008 RepID=A0A1J4MA15_9CRYT|nr:hypothetical protein cand_019040 [Cryptosporidium andersoni]